MYAKDHPDIKSLEEVCEAIKPSVAIGKTLFPFQRSFRTNSFVTFNVGYEALSHVISIRYNIIDTGIFPRSGRYTRRFHREVYQINGVV